MLLGEKSFLEHEKAKSLGFTKPILCDILVAEAKGT